MPEVINRASRLMQRDRFVSEPNLDQQFRAALYAAGYSSDVVPTARFRVESRETLDRNYGGNWWEANRDALKMDICLPYFAKTFRQLTAFEDWRPPAASSTPAAKRR